MSSGIKHILDKAVAGDRLTSEDGVALLQSHDLIAIGKAADAVTKRKAPPTEEKVQGRLNGPDGVDGFGKWRNGLYRSHTRWA